MGLLKKLLSPKNMVHSMVDPVGATVGTAVTGNTGVSSYYDPLGLAKKSGSDSASSGTDPAVEDPSGGSYYGDPNDPGYGSLTDPFTVEDFYNYADPGYAFRLQQGTQGLQNSAAAQSGALSGAALKDLLTFNQDYASTEYGNAFNRYQTQQGNIFSRLSDIAHLGQNAAAGVGAQGAALAGNAGQQAYNAGSAAGAGTVGAGNALSQGAQNYWLYNNPQMWRGNQSAPGGV
jgi:hypothetical protein